MSKQYKAGDRVLIEAVVSIPPSNEARCIVYAPCRPDDAMFVEDEHIIGLASEFEREQDNDGWIEIKSGCEIPKLLEKIFITEHGDVSVGIYDGTPFRKTIKAWRPYPSPYIPPAKAFECDKCQHAAVCYHVCHVHPAQERTHCGGEHYAEKEASHE